VPPPVYFMIDLKASSAMPSGWADITIET